MIQADLDFFGVARRTDPETSKIAAAKVNANKLSQLVIEALTHGPKTSEEAAAWLGRELGSITPRFKPLEAAGLIERSTLRREGKSGTKRVVWMLKGGV